MILSVTAPGNLIAEDTINGKKFLVFGKYKSYMPRNTDLGLPAQNVPFKRSWPPVLESMRASEPGLQAPSILAGSKIKNTHFSPLINSFSEISNIGKRTHHVICTYSEGKAIKPMNLKFFAKYSLLQAPSKHENRLAGSGGVLGPGADHLLMSIFDANISGSSTRGGRRHLSIRHLSIGTSHMGPRHESREKILSMVNFLIFVILYIYIIFVI